MPLYDMAPHVLMMLLRPNIFDFHVPQNYSLLGQSTQNFTELSHRVHIHKETQSKD